MLAFLLAPIYLLFNFYIMRWAIWWMSACSHHFKKKWIRAVFLILYLFLCTSILTAFLLPKGKLKFWMSQLGNYWLGTFLYILLTVIIVDLIRMVLKRMKRIDQKKLASRRLFVLNGTICIAVIISLTAYGIINAHNIQTTSYDVSVEKECGDISSLNIILVADLHLGYNIGEWHMGKMVENINRLNPDIVCIAGDIFDNEYDAIPSPDKTAATLAQIRSRYGVYACYGNHDIDEKILAGFTFHKKGKKMSDPRMDQFLNKAQITLLKDETALIDDRFYLSGRADYERPGRDITTRMTPEELTAGLDLSKPVIVIDHEPREMDALSSAGVDLDLCGHTHDGQMFPGNLTINLLWDNPYGYKAYGNMQQVVTSGVGVFGPYMRVGTKSEIVQITAEFKPSDSKQMKQ